jgi:hypothetical protein
MYNPRATRPRLSAKNARAPRAGEPGVGALGVQLSLPAPRRQRLRGVAHRRQVRRLAQGVSEVHVLEQAGVEQLEQVRPGGLVRRVQQRASRGHEVEVPLHLNHTMLEHTF